MPREHEHEILDNSSGKSIGKAWWNPDKEKIEGSPAALKMIFSNHSMVTDSDEDLIRNLSRSFRNGYVTAKKVK